MERMERYTLTTLLPLDFINRAKSVDHGCTLGIENKMPVTGVEVLIIIIIADLHPF